MSVDLQQLDEPALRDFVYRVEQRLEEVVEDERDTAGGDRIRSGARHLGLAPAAKRARPRLVYHFGRLTHVSVPRLVPIAVAAELVHTASLLHDDVVDAGTERRNRETVNVRWDNITAVLTGDAMLCHALTILRPFPEAARNRAVDVVAEMTRSILHEVTSRGKTDLARSDWEEIAEGKTGALFGWCGAAPALTGDYADLADRLDTCGRRLGIAFQLADDLKDLVDIDAGKDPFADLRNGHPSYPVICALDEDATLHEDLEHLWADLEATDGSASGTPSVESIASRILETDAIDETRDRVRREVDRALEALGDHTETAGGAQIVEWAERLCANI